jgi:hypothetical protein
MDVGTGHNSLAGGTLHMHPGGEARTPSKEILDNPKLTAPIKRAYQSAVNTANAKEWNGAATLCRRLLEGVLKTSLPEAHRSGTLADQLRRLPQHLDLEKPVIDLADVVRKAGNAGAHFDEDRESDERTVNLMLDLCEDLLDYLFTIPLRIDHLNKQLATNTSTQNPVDTHAQ